MCRDLRSTLTQSLILKLVRYGANLSAGRTPGDTDEERLSNNDAVLIPVSLKCLTVTGHTCNVPLARLCWKITLAKLRPHEHTLCCILIILLIKMHLNVFVFLVHLNAVALHLNTLIFVLVY